MSNGLFPDSKKTLIAKGVGELELAVAEGVSFSLCRLLSETSNS